MSPSVKHWKPLYLLCAYVSAVLDHNGTRTLGNFAIGIPCDIAGTGDSLERHRRKLFNQCGADCRIVIICRYAGSFQALRNRIDGVIGISCELVRNISVLILVCLDECLCLFV